MKTSCVLWHSTQCNEIRVRLYGKSEECAVERFCVELQTLPLDQTSIRAPCRSAWPLREVLCPCLRCEETVIVQQQVFKSIPVRQSPAVSSELWCGLGGCQGAFGVLWSSWLTHILCMLLDSLILPMRPQGSIYLHFCWVEKSVNWRSKKTWKTKRFQLWQHKHSNNIDTTTQIVGITSWLCAVNNSHAMPDLIPRLTMNGFFSFTGMHNVICLHHKFF